MNRREFESMLRSAVDGARHIVTVKHEQLLPVVMMWGEGRMHVVGISDVLPREALDELRELARQHRAEAAVTIAEAYAMTPQGMGDVAILYAVWPAQGETRLVGFDITDDKFEPCNLNIRAEQVEWLDAVLSPDRKEP